MKYGYRKMSDDERANVLKELRARLADDQFQDKPLGEIDDFLMVFLDLGDSIFDFKDKWSSFCVGGYPMRGEIRMLFEPEEVVEVPTRDTIIRVMHFLDDTKEQTQSFYEDW